jgi:RNA polymerase sigma factor (sigma-70 family)
MDQHQRVGYELDLTKLGDEQLVVLAIECQFPAAEETLLLRHYAWSNQLITCLARRRQLAANDLEDAKQDAVFGMVKAIARYNTLQFSKPRGCPFLAFLRRVLTDRFKDFVKYLRRREHHLDRWASAMAQHHPGSNSLGGGYGTASDQGPVAAAEWQEMREQVHRVVSQLDAATRAFVEGVMAGLRLRIIATQMGLSYDAAKRRWRRLRSLLAIQLRQVSGDSSGLDPRRAATPRPPIALPPSA